MFPGAICIGSEMFCASKREFQESLLNVLRSTPNFVHMFKMLENKFLQSFSPPSQKLRSLFQNIGICQTLRAHHFVSFAFFNIPFSVHCYLQRLINYCSSLEALNPLDIINGFSGVGPGLSSCAQWNRWKSAVNHLNQLHLKFDADPLRFHRAILKTAFWQVSLYEASPFLRRGSCMKLFE